MSIELMAVLAGLWAVLKFRLFSGEPVFSIWCRPLAYTAAYARKSFPRSGIVVTAARTYTLWRTY